MDPKPEEEKNEDLSEKIYKDLHERDTEYITKMDKKNKFLSVLVLVELIIIIYLVYYMKCR